MSGPQPQPIELNSRQKEILQRILRALCHAGDEVDVVEELIKEALDQARHQDPDRQAQVLRAVLCRASGQRPVNPSPSEQQQTQP